MASTTYTKADLDKEAKYALSGHKCPDKGHTLHVKAWEIEFTPGTNWIALQVKGECKRCGYEICTNAAI